MNILNNALIHRIVTSLNVLTTHISSIYKQLMIGYEHFLFHWNFYELSIWPWLAKLN